MNTTTTTTNDSKTIRLSPNFAQLEGMVADLRDFRDNFELGHRTGHTTHAPDVQKDEEYNYNLLDRVLDVLAYKRREVLVEEITQLEIEIREAPVREDRSGELMRLYGKLRNDF